MNKSAAANLKKFHKSLPAIIYGAVIFCALFVLMISSARVLKAATFNVTNLDDTGMGSLRAAIDLANANADADIITFGVAGTITPATSLPIITSPLIINGYSAPGATVNSGAIDAGFNGTLVVELNGSSAGDLGIGLRFSVPNCLSSTATSNCIVQGLVINRFRDSGIRIDAGNNVRVFGNFIGTNLAGTAALGNFNRGILIVGSTGHRIGFTDGASRNVISGNFGTGISITGGGSATVRRNLIGTDKTGTLDLGNTQDGVRIVDSSNSVIGTDGDRNIISGNDANGVAIVQSGMGTSATGNTVTANYIGVTISGNTAAVVGGFQTSPVGNSGSGVLINAAGNSVIGGTTSSARSVISGNRANGVSVASSFATGNIVTGNYIGVGANGTATIGNRDNGVQISNLASGNTVGGTSVTAGACSGACNIIANNGASDANSARAGVYIDSTSSAGNVIRQNSIFNNNGIGIDLGVPGAGANDNADPDTGANNLQNVPVITSAGTNGSIQGSLNSTPNSTFAIDFYSNTSADGNMSEGRTYIGSTSATTDASGITPTFTFTAAAQTVGQLITATATSVSGSVQAIGDTSEFSAAQTVVGSPAASGFESDVILRPDGDGFIDSDDVQRVRQFVVGGMAFQSNEFQRADSSPRNAVNGIGGGDGFIDADDVQQARRYTVGFDGGRTPAGGPTGPPMRGEKSSAQNSDSKRSPMAGRAVRVVSQMSSAGATVTVPINVDTTGDETGYSFSLSFDRTRLTATNVTAGDLGGGTPVFNINNTDGTIGFSISGFNGPNGTIAEVTNMTLVRVTFTVTAGAPAGAVALNFTDNPTRRRVSGVDPNSPPPQPSFTGGTVTIAAPTAAPAAVSGRLQTATGAGIPRASVTLLDTSSGETFTTMTNVQGVYVFEGIAVGNDYIVTPTALGYTFNPRSKYFSLLENLSEVDFVGVRGRKRTL